MCDPISLTLSGLMLAGAGYGAYSSYQQGSAQKRFQESQAAATRVAAEAQAAEMNRQADLELQRAGIAQLQGEQEAARRSRAMASDIGAAYARYAGNGLLVDSGSPNDVFGSVLKSTVAEGIADVETIRDNTAINVWNFEANRQSLLAGAQNALAAGRNQSMSLIASGGMAKTAGRNSAISTGLSGVGSAAAMGIQTNASLNNSLKGKTVLGYTYGGA